MVEIMLHIDIRTISHEAQRYPTVGDYIETPEGHVRVSVSSMDDTYKEILVAIHELVEYYLCRIRGIEEKDIAAFDMEFECKRLPGDISEPGDSLQAPYRREHRFAENIERQICLELGLDWNEYDKTVLAL